jgi:diguanylate cyclase
MTDGLAGAALAVALRCGEQALAGMRRHAVPATPRNYAVWYAYAAGSAPELTRTINILISNNQEFTEARNDELFARFIADDPECGLLKRTGDQLHETMTRVLGFIEQATGNTRAYGDSLEGYSARLGEDGGLERLRETVTSLIAETERVVAENRSLERKLTRSSGEIAELRHTLELVQREAMTDALTGIPNRKCFEARLRDAATDAMECGEPLSLLLLDIDHFKRFNDSYGHQVGDQVLRLVARTLTDCVKGRDTAARYGGEEFVIILPQTRLADALRLAEHIRGTMMRCKIVRRESRDDLGSITLSIGVSHYMPGEPLAEMVRRADAALYLAKRKGRNRVISERELAPTDLAVGS